MSDPSVIPGPILCAHLLRRVDAKLIELLRSLALEEWDLPTIVPHWTVREVAAHLLDTPLRKLSLVRDGCAVEQVEIRSPEDVVDLVNRLNREGVAVYRRLSPPVLIRLMEFACEESACFHESLDPFAPAVFNVSWAGESQSLNWFDTARELTERWHHQQQIRLAADRPGIMVPELYHPVLDCFIRGLPHLYREVDAPEGTAVLLEISGDCGGQWAFAKDALAKGKFAKTGSEWMLRAPAAVACASRVTIPQEIAWRVFTKGIDRAEARAQCAIEGDAALGEKVLQLTAIVG